MLQIGKGLKTRQSQLLLLVCSLALQILSDGWPLIQYQPFPCCTRKGKARIRKMCTPLEYVIRPFLFVGLNLYIFGFRKTLRDHSLVRKYVPLNKQNQVEN